jgi:hypothetical protein
VRTSATVSLGPQAWTRPCRLFGGERITRARCGFSTRNFNLRLKPVWTPPSYTLATAATLSTFIGKKVCWVTVRVPPKLSPFLYRVLFFSQLNYRGMGLCITFFEGIQCALLRLYPWAHKHGRDHVASSEVNVSRERDVGSVPETSTSGLNPFGRKFICSHLDHDHSLREFSAHFCDCIPGPTSMDATMSPLRR